MAARRAAEVEERVEPIVDDEAHEEEAPITKRPAPVWERTWTDVREYLDKPIPPSWFSTREAMDRSSGRGSTITYIPWYNAARWLNAWADGWSYEVSDPVYFPGGERIVKRTGEVETIPATVSVTTVLVFQCKDQTVRRGATAAIAVTEVGYGAASERAERASFCRAFALCARSALNLYAKE